MTIYVAGMHGVNTKLAWSENALPLFDVEAPLFKDVPVQPGTGAPFAGPAVEGGNAAADVA